MFVFKYLQIVVYISLLSSDHQNVARCWDFFEKNLKTLKK